MRPCVREGEGLGGWVDTEEVAAGGVEHCPFPVVVFEEFG